MTHSRLSRHVAIGLSVTWLLTLVVSAGTLVVLAGWIGVGDVFIAWSVLSLPLYVVTLRNTRTRLAAWSPAALLVAWVTLLGAAVGGADHQPRLPIWVLLALYAGFPLGVVVSASVALFRATVDRSKLFAPAS